MAENNLQDWFVGMRQHQGVKLVTGPRGWGKSAQLKAFRQWLLDHGVPPERILMFNAEHAPVNRFVTPDQVVDFINSQVGSPNLSYVLIQEGGGLPMPATTLAELSNSSNYNIFVTASSRQFLTRGDNALKDKVSIYECPPRILPRETAFSRWNESMLNDALLTNRLLDASLLVRIMRCLSDSLGDPISLRAVCMAVSPQGKTFSPHTISTYLAVLEDAHLVEKGLVFDDFAGVVNSSGYRYFFMDPSLRVEVFGPSPTEEERRMNLNLAWLQLREKQRVYMAPKGSLADFITCPENGKFGYWKATASGAEECDLPPSNSH